MTRIPAAALACAIAYARIADAHQLDEYLQATRIAVEHDRIVLEMSLTPGVAVARQIFASIDRDGDRQISALEAEAYGRGVLREVVLELDDRPLVPALVRAEYPAWPELRDGLGTIRLEAAAGVPIPRGRHHLRFVNHHRSDVGIYLVNALMPSTSAISIRAQQRDVLQHGIRLELDRAAAYVSAVWIVFPLVGVAALVLIRRPAARR